MTTITLQDEQKLPKTDFKNLAALLDWAVDHFTAESPLSAKIIAKSQQARKEKLSAHSTFKKVA